MKRSLFDLLLDAKRTRRPAVLVTHLRSGEQTLLVAGVQHGAPLPKGEDFEEQIKAIAIKDAGGIINLGSSDEDQEETRYFIQPYNPSKRLLIVGAVHISQALAPMAMTAGYETIVIDPREAWATQERFPGIPLDRRWPDEAFEEMIPDRGAAIVTLTHDPKIDDPALEAALSSDAFYIGALGGRKTHGKRIARLTEAGFSEAQIARIHAPIGLDIGAVSPAEIAVAILAEVTLALRGSKRSKVTA